MNDQKQEPLTRVLPTTAGRELDALVADKVMGLTFSRNIYGEVLRNYSEGGGTIPYYSTDIAAAWLVVEKMAEKKFSVIVGTNECAPKQNGVKFFEGFRGLGHSIFGGDEHPNPYAIAETVPLAICLAALKAVGA